jgi:chromosome segregation ATPase
MGFDYVPDGFMVQGDKLVPRPPDPFVEIERLKLKLNDLQRRIDMGENAEQAAGLKDLREKLGAMERENRELKKQADGAVAHATTQTAKVDELKGVIMELKYQVSEFEKLPPATSSIEELAKANKKIAKLEADITAYLAHDTEFKAEVDAKEKVLYGEVVELREKLKKSETAYVTAIEKLTNATKQLESMTRSAILEKSELEAKVADLRKQAEDLASEKAEQAKDLQYWKDKATELQGGVVKKPAKKG